MPVFILSRGNAYNKKEGIIMEDKYYEVWSKDYFSGKYCRNCRFLYQESMDEGCQKKCALDHEVVEPSDKGCSRFEP